MRIGRLFQDVLHCEHTYRINIIGMKYVQIQVEVDILKPLLTGFFHKIRKEGTWIQFAYKCLAEFCYFCGRVAHGKSLCSLQSTDIQDTGSIQYGLWIRGEANAFTVVKEGNSLRRIDIPRGEISIPFPKMSIQMLELKKTLPNLRKKT